MSAVTTPRPRLYISQEPGLELFSAVEFGRVDDGQPSERWLGVGAHVGLLHDDPNGRCVGFVIKDPDGYDPDDPDHASLWEEPRFDVPTLGLSDVPPNAVFVAARALFGAERTINRCLFNQAIRADDEQALELWMRCLQAGDSMAHYSLGYTLFGLGRIPEAYRHLRHYTEIAPGDVWTWVWFGKAAAALGELGEARAAFTRAIEIEEQRDEAPEDRSDAADLLEKLDAGEIEVPLPPAPVKVSDGRLAPLERLMEELRFERRLIIDGTAAYAIFDAEWVPVRLHLDGNTGALQLEAQIGVALDGDDDMRQLFSDLGRDAADVYLDNGDVWLISPVPAALAELDVRSLEILVRGVSATAARLFDTMTEFQPADDPPLDPPPTYDELLANEE